ncbi:hypothetical protein BDV37DRAFT_121159 [Aspergillus pseudonomiae]|uniref:Uncharacterized protein n=1 Tax=Aspergillus pseudonomiae TaxID=1506151 RepID=A0A5N7DCK3_9EURO|nr:uncharacterized protein BDV37DRAFT_121159 [Aspergillus pseudonomiae]KAE8403974.1 hypothetical protein BDV37DRAFT_121159 [Aspergillus pseudonomiae]
MIMIPLNTKKWLISDDHGPFSSLSTLVEMFSVYVHIYALGFVTLHVILILICMGVYTMYRQCLTGFASLNQVRPPDIHTGYTLKI